MKVKAISLIFLVIFTAIATSVVLHLSSGQIIQENGDFTKSYNIVQVDDEVGVEPDGKEIDCPAMPG